MNTDVRRANRKWMYLGRISLLKYKGTRYNKSIFMG
jgi:hypothetical protein